MTTPGDRIRGSVHAAIDALGDALHAFDQLPESAQRERLAFRVLADASIDLATQSLQHVDESDDSTLGEIRRARAYRDSMSTKENE